MSNQPQPAYCPTCDRNTLHNCYDGQIGSCREHRGPDASQKQIRERRQRKAAERQPRLFKDDPTQPLPFIVKGGHQ